MYSKCRYFPKPGRKVDMIRIDRLYNDYKQRAQLKADLAQEKELQQQRTTEEKQERRMTQRMSIGRRMTLMTPNDDQDSSSDDDSKKPPWSCFTKSRRCSVPGVVAMLANDPQVYAPPFMQAANDRWDIAPDNTDVHEEPIGLKVFDDHRNQQLSAPPSMADHPGYGEFSGCRQRS